MKIHLMSLVAAIAVCAGCGDLAAPPTAQNLGAPTQPPVETMPDSAATVEAANEAPPAGQNVIRRVAEVGVGEQGRGYGGGIITEPLRQRFRIQHQLMFLQVDQALKLFKAQEDRSPNSHEEFMKKIIKPNQLALPKLPQGHRYVYDPELKKLMVERPRP